jgi:hypothetical protein
MCCTGSSKPITTNKNILVVGGGDSAIEAALGLAHQRGDKVTLSYCRNEFSRIKDRNAKRIQEHKQIPFGRPGKAAPQPIPANLHPTRSSLISPKTSVFMAEPCRLAAAVLPVANMTDRVWNANLDLYRRN